VASEAPARQGEWAQVSPEDVVDEDEDVDVELVVGLPPVPDPPVWPPHTFVLGTHR
jgi:hypothetical protein